MESAPWNVCTHRNSQRTVKASGYRWNRNKMEETEVLIIGQGLSGSWLGYWLHQAGISFRVIDQPDSERGIKTCSRTDQSGYRETNGNDLDD